VALSDGFVERDLASIRLPRWGRVVAAEGVVPWLAAVGVDWDKATSAEVRDFVLWLGQAAKPRSSPRTASAATAGTVNAVTRKRYLGDQYEPRTVRHGKCGAAGLL